MALKLVHDANVATIPIANLNDLGGMARDLGERLDGNEFGDVVTIVTLIVTEDGLSIHSFGECPSGYELMGMFETAKLQCFADNVAGDE